MAPSIIKREDIQLVRSRANIEEIVSEHVTLKNAGLGSMKGLCPFHDEKTPSFTVRPAIGRYHCFGCGEDGDTISFVQNMMHMSFVEAVEYLASRYSVQLRYEESPSGGGRDRGPRTDFGTRQRLYAAHEVAEEFYREQLMSPEAEVGRRFLAERAFGPQSAQKFGVGYAPQGWDSLTRHLRLRGFTEEELTLSGLASQGQRGVYDRFRGRLVWPIRDVTGKTIGFGARKLYDDDQGPKYLNTPETPIYKKSQVLYGLDLARKNISGKRQVVVMEGYTDVMAAHEAGIDTAVASCGTAFGSEHVTLVRRIMGDHSAMSALSHSSMTEAITGIGGEVVFTFDGDEAGQKAALKAFGEDQRFVAQTFVAVDPQGMDPCDIRIHRGDEALRRLIDQRMPMFEFAIKAALKQVNLDTVEGQIAGLRMAAPVVAQIRDKAILPEYARRLSGWVGLDERTVLRAVHEAGKVLAEARRYTRALENRAHEEGEGTRLSDPTHPPRTHEFDSHRGPSEPHAAHPGEESTALDDGTLVLGALTLADVMQPRDPVVLVEVQALALILQSPHVLDPRHVQAIPDDAFGTHALQSVWDCVLASGMLDDAVDGTVSVRDLLDIVMEIAGATVKPLIGELVSFALPARTEDQLRKQGADLIMRLNEISLTHAYSELRRQLGRLDPTREGEEYARVLAKISENQAALHALKDTQQA